MIKFLSLVYIRAVDMINSLSYTQDYFSIKHFVQICNFCSDVSERSPSIFRPLRKNFCSDGIKTVSV